MKVLQAVPLGFFILVFWTGATQSAPLHPWTASFKLGEYQPAADSFGSQYAPQAIRGDIEFGYRISREFEAGVGLGYFSDAAFVHSVSGRISALTQQLTLIPLQIYMTWQLLLKDDQVWVPYFGGGYTHISFRHSIEGEDMVSGGINGYHLRGGLKILLNTFEADSARKLYDDWGVIHTYFLLEGQYTRADGFDATAPDLGGWSYFGGLRFEY